MVQGLAPVCLFVCLFLRKVTVIESDDFGYNYITVHTSCLVHDEGVEWGFGEGGLGLIVHGKVSKLCTIH